MSSLSRGVPSVTYIRVLGSGLGQGDTIVDGNTVTVLEPGALASRHDVAQVIDKGINDDETCELTIGDHAGAGLGAALNPVTAFVLDAATAVITIVGSRNTKKSLFLKKTFLPFLANEIFSTIIEREHSSANIFDAHVSLSCFEIQDEIITDLLRPSSRGLNISMSAEDGVVINGIYKETISEEMHLRQKFADSCDNRASHTLPPGASLDTSTAVWEIELRQTESDDNNSSADTMRRCYSRLVVVDVASVDALVQGGPNLRQLESPTLYKSLISFADIVKRLSTPSKAALAPFRTSKLTHYLSEMLGGNAIVVGLGIIANGEPAVSRKTLEIIGGLTSAVHYPIGGRELTDVLHGLLCKYRAMILQLQDEIAHGGPIGDHPIEYSAEKIAQLQRDMATALLDRNVAKEDRSRIFEMMELLKAKYNTVVKEKATQSIELIKSEEDKLSIAHALVQLKLEYSQLQEEAEKAKFESTSALLAAKNAYFDLDSQLLSEKATLQSTIEEKNSIEKLLNQKAEELAATASLLLEVRDRLYREEDKNVELGAELLTLVNTREALKAKIVELNHKLELAAVELSTYNKQGEEKAMLIDQSRSKQREAEDELSAIMKLLTETELELLRVNNELQHVKDETDKAMEDMRIELNLEKSKSDEQKAAFNKQSEDEKRRMQQEWLNKDKNKFEVMPVADAQQSYRRYERKIRDLEKDYKRVQDDLKAVTTDKKDTEKELLSLRNAYRGKLSSLLIDDDQEKKDASGITSIATGAAATGVGTAAKNNWKSALNAVQPTTAAPSAAKTNWKSVLNASKTANATTPTSASQGDSQPPGASSLPSKSLADTDIQSDTILKELLSTYTDNERRLRSDVDATMANASTSTAALRILYDKYRAALDAIEDHLPSVDNDIARDAINETRLLGEAALADVTDVLYKNEKFEQDLMKSRLRQAESGAINDQTRATVILQTYKKNLDKTEKKLAEAKMEIADLHAQIRQLIDAKDGAGKSIAKQQQLQEKEALINELQEQLTTQLTKLNSPRPPSSFDPLSTGEQAMMAALNEAKEYIARLEGNAPAAVVYQLRETEKRIAKYMSDNSAISEELNAYRDYMRAVATNYKKQIIALKQQIDKQSNKHTSISSKNGAVADKLTIDTDDVNRGGGQYDKGDGVDKLPSLSIKQSLSTIK